jgi:hypothetical protein
MNMGNMASEKRFDFLNKFRDSDCPNFVSRIRLVNVNFNQLTCCTRILFTGIDPSPAAIRQMQKRLNRIGQDKPVHCTFLISQLPPRVRTTPNSTGAVTDMEASLGAISGLNEDPQNVETEFYRPLSYEERLFALVLRRENAIKQTLQQADRQRDPQELYEMLKDRQTLNQLLQDIVEDAKNDTDISNLIRGMEEVPSISKMNTESFTFTTSPVIEVQEASTSKEVQDYTTRYRETSPYRNLSNTEILSGLPELPEGYEFSWKAIRKQSTILQGELF